MPHENFTFQSTGTDVVALGDMFSICDPGERIPSPERLRELAGSPDGRGIASNRPNLDVTSCDRLLRGA